MPAYQIALGIALIVIGAALVCAALILRYREQTEPPDHPHDADAGDLREFVDSLQQTDEITANVGPRIDHLRR